MLLVAAAVLSGLGLMLLVAGLLGRTMGTEPRCRRCGHDLRGHEMTPAVCPECGRRLRGGRAIRLGRRKRRVAAAVIGAVLLLAGVTPWTPVASRSISNVDVNQWKPLWWLRADLESNVPESSKAAAREIVRRIEAGDLHSDDVEPIVSWVLVLQADATKGWEPEYGDIVGAAWERALIDRATAAKYLETGFRASQTYAIAPTVRRGEQLEHWITTGSMRLGNRLGVRITQDNRFEHPLLSRHRNQSRRTTSTPFRKATPARPARGSGGTVGFFQLPPLGPTEITYVSQVKVDFHREGALPTLPAPGPLTSFEIRHVLTTTVVPDEPLNSRPTMDPALREAVQQSLRGLTLRLTREGDTISIGGGVADCTSPVDLYFQVALRLDGRLLEMRNTAAQFESSEGFTDFGILGSMSREELPEDVERIDVILTPSAVLAEAVPFEGGREFWGEVLEVTGVPITWKERKKLQKRSADSPPGSAPAMSRPGKWRPATTAGPVNER